MLSKQSLARTIIASRKFHPAGGMEWRKSEAEGGCGVIGISSSEKIPARHLLPALRQMCNRGNGKGGGIALVGLAGEQFGVTNEVLEKDYLINIAYLDPSARKEVEQAHIEPVFEVDHFRVLPQTDDYQNVPVKPPEVCQYFVRVRPSVLADFASTNRIALPPESEETVVHLEDEIVYQNGYCLNRNFYASTGTQRAFVLSQGKNMLVIKMVGYGDDVIHCYKLEDVQAHVLIGHHRYPTKGRVWHPGGAHPFAALNEALVHNGDFANYSSICEYLSERKIYPLFLTDTEVSVLVYDLLLRTYGYPLEYVIESLAPTTERDCDLLPAEKQEIYRLLQISHIHGSPDGPWFFLIAESDESRRASRLIGITDTSMLRPQVFALQQGQVSVGFAASEKQAIDATLESLASKDERFWSRADCYWSARGGSHTDGGAFIFTVLRDEDGKAKLECTDKFGRKVAGSACQPPYGKQDELPRSHVALPDLPAKELFCWVKNELREWDYGKLASFLNLLENNANSDAGAKKAIDVLTLLMDRRYDTGAMRPSCLLSLIDKSFGTICNNISALSLEQFVHVTDGKLPPECPCSREKTIVLDARGFVCEGDNSLARTIAQLACAGYCQFIVAHTKGHRFIANGLGPDSSGMIIHVYGSPGDYLASGIDGAEVIVHASGQDQLAQIMKSGKLVIYGDVGQTFMYSAKGGSVFVLGNAAGRPLINAVGKPRVVINGTCLDYLAESFMAGDPLAGGGFVIINGIRMDDQGKISNLPEPYPGSNLFSLASGGAIYIRDPKGTVSENQLNGGRFVSFKQADWLLIKPHLEENERLFDIPVATLLQVDGTTLSPEHVYRKIRPAPTEALEPEEAWVTMKT